MQFQKMKSFLIFEKWTKINVQKWDIQKVLTDRFFSYDIEILSSQIKPKNKSLLLYFFQKYFLYKYIWKL